ncbi:NAD(P)/FAD-dependent oxidoreductase [Candidatus Woesearchaeota archaeon]|nr:NAD(P)/FAD-dependent oxidoreductase [Candidatus Woesearchaeota archaeon]
MSDSDYDVIVIGAGPAGMSSAVFTARASLKTLVIGDPDKSQLITASEVGNYLFADGRSGRELLDAGIAQVEKYGAQLLVNEAVHIVKEESGVFRIKTADAKEYAARAVVLAIGVSYIKSGIKNEQELKGKGVHYCVACDGYFYKGKKVLVVGNGNYAAEEAIELLAYTKDITIISNGREFSISPELMVGLQKGSVKLRKDKAFEFVKDASSTAAAAKSKLTVIFKDNSKEDFDGAFIALGAASTVGFANKLGMELDSTGFIVADKNGMTSVEGVYAAGSCTGGTFQMAKSVGEGCVAAISIVKKLRGIENYSDLT